MIQNLSKVYSPVIKKFLLEKIGFDSIGGFTIMDGETIGFLIRQMSFIVDCKTMSVKRQIDTSSDGGIYVNTILNDDCVKLVEKNLKTYVNAEIENMEK